MRWVRAGAIVLVPLLLLGASGCSSPQPPERVASAPSSSRAARPAFSSKKAALAEAERQYRRYLVAVQQVAEDDGRGIQRLARFVTPRELEEEREALRDGKKAGLRSSGPVTLVLARAQSVDVNRGTVAAYVCVDLSGLVLRDANGKDVTSADRADRQTFVASYKVVRGQLLLDRQATWSGRSIC